MKYVFTKHAKERIKKRKISKLKVINAIKKPDLKAIDDKGENKIAYYQKITDEISLKVVTVPDDDRIRILTVHPIATRRLKNIKNLIEML